MPFSDITLSYTEIILRLFLAALFGGVIGVERERTSRYAGLRTNMLVCIGSTLMMLVSQYGFHGVLYHELIVLDPSRIAAQVVSGIGFLGAGTILFTKDKISGLTTAASLWAVAGIGLAVGGGLYFAAFISTSLMFIVLVFFKRLELKFFKKIISKEIKFIIEPLISFKDLEAILIKLNLRNALENLQIDIKDKKEIITLVLSDNTQSNILNIADEMKTIKGVEKIEIIE